LLMNIPINRVVVDELSLLVGPGQTLMIFQPRFFVSSQPGNWLPVYSLVCWMNWLN
jgi:hypothetical protein